LDIKIAEQTLLPLRAKLQVYANLPFGKELISKIEKVIEFTEKDIIELYNDDETYELEELYETVLNELAKFYATFFKYLCFKEFTVIKTNKEKTLLRKYKKSEKQENILKNGKELANLISKRFEKENPEILKRDKNFMSYFERKIIERIIEYSKDKALDYFEQLDRVQQTTERLFPKRDYYPNKKYTIEDFNFVIELKEKDGIPFVRGVQKLEELKKKKINYDSFLRRLSDYYNKGSLN
jgi:hypothetical protein